MQRIRLGRIGEVGDRCAYVYCMELTFGTGSVIPVEGRSLLGSLMRHPGSLRSAASTPFTPCGPSPASCLRAHHVSVGMPGDSEALLVPSPLGSSQVLRRASIPLHGRTRLDTNPQHPHITAPPQLRENQRLTGVRVGVTGLCE